jgi:pimeloyl-ACP methyl ester carboxylesterase
MTACYQLLLGAVPSLNDDGEALRLRIEGYTPARLPGMAGRSWSAGVPSDALHGYVHDWLRWLDQPPQPSLGEHRVFDNGAGPVHTVTVPGRGDLPCVLLHGWPTSFLAFHQLVNAVESTFSHCVLVSLPGFGTSALLTPENADATSMARTVLSAVRALGHDQFVVHGEDWGSIVAREMGRLDPQRVIGVHVSAALGPFLPNPANKELGAERLRTFVGDAGGYLRLQSTRPDSLAHALADSPVGLLAWQLDKVQLWQEQLPGHFGLGADFVFANATLYALTGCIGTSLRIYTENAGRRFDEPSRTPTAISVFGAADFATEEAASRHHRIVACYEHDSGGHVAALDATELLADDLADFVQQL